MSSSFSKHFARLQIPLADILYATNSFSDTNLIGENAVRKAYKGKLSLSKQQIDVDIVAHRLLGKEKEAILQMEISTVSSLKHENLVSIVGFCDEEDEKIIIYKHEANGSLSEHLGNQSLTWMQRLNICVGVARALRYIHYDEKRKFSLIHRNITTSQILLDEKWIPKLSGFEYSKKITKARRNRLHLGRFNGTKGYIDPSYEKTGGVTHKWDVYSLGVVLFEVLCGRRAYIPASGSPNKQFWKNESEDVVGKQDDQTVEHDGLSPHQLANQQHSTPESPVVVMEKTDEIIQHAGRSLSSDKMAKQHSTEGSQLDGSVKHDQGFSPDQLPKQNYPQGKLYDRDLEGEGPSPQLANQPVLDAAENLDEVVEYEGSSRQLAKQHSMEALLNVTRKLDEIVDHVGHSPPLAKQNSSEIYNFTPAMRSAWDMMPPSVSGMHINRTLIPDYPEEWTCTAGRSTTQLGGVDQDWTKNDLKSYENFPSLVHQNYSVMDLYANVEGLGLSGYVPRYRSQNREGLGLSGARNSMTGLNFRDAYKQFNLLYDSFSEPHEKELLAPLAISHYDDGTLEDIVDLDLWKQIDKESFKIFSKTAYLCLKEKRSERPHIDQIVSRLENALYHQTKREKSLKLEEKSQVVAEVEGTSTNHLKWKDIEHLMIGFHDIKVATKEFTQNKIGCGGFGDVYKAELKHFDSSKSLAKEGKNLSDLPKISSTVAVKVFLKRKGTEADKSFTTEIKTLTSCEHPNIVSILGFCDEDSKMILVYEYVPNKSLLDHLESEDKKINLKWAMRLQICLDIAKGLNYLHTEKKIIHRDIKSANILLDSTFRAKIGDFGLSKIIPESQEVSSIKTKVSGTRGYVDPEYTRTRVLKKASDIYSLGVVMFEIVSGTYANDTGRYPKGLAHFAREWYSKKGTIASMVDPILMEEVDEENFTLSKGPNQDSLKTFFDVAYLCLADAQAERPKIGHVISKIKDALKLQENHKDNLKISLEDIISATNNFNTDNIIGRGGFGTVYHGRQTNIAAKRLDKAFGQGETEFLTELETVLEYKHENVIGLVGFCNEFDENIIIYEYASKGSLDTHLKDSDLPWMQRLQICIDIVSGLDFLHGGGLTQEVVVHRDLKSSNILLMDDWKAKITDFGLSLICPINEETDFVIDHNACGTLGYCDPGYLEGGFLTKESDIYSLGIVLFEILCGRLVCEVINGNPNITNFKRIYERGELGEMVFEGIKGQIARKSLNTFQRIAFQCLHNDREKRPTTGQVLLQLKEAKKFQDDYDTWKPKLPNDYEEIIQMSNTPGICITEMKKDLYDKFTKGILIQEEKLLFTLGGNGQRTEMLSAKTFSYVNGCRHKWQSVQESRFPIVAEMLDILNLRIKIKTRTQLLSRDVVYGVFLVFKFCGTKKVSTKPLYVNLKYRIGSKTSHAYFATRRDDNWMMIELWRFLNNKDDIVFKFLLDSFSGYYRGDSTVFVEGIEFRAADDVTLEEIRELKQIQKVPKSDSNMDLLQQLPTNPEVILMNDDDDDEKSLLTSEVNAKKHLRLSAKDALYDSSNGKLFKTQPSVVDQSRFPEVIELLPQQVFLINCSIKSEMLSQDTDYVCYIVFKLSKKCHGLHCPVQVRDLLHWSDAEADTIYFRSPKPWNLHDANQAPKQRADGWMEVKLWKFNLSNEFEDDDFHVNLRLFSYEGTMSGLIVRGLEFRPM